MQRYNLVIYSKSNHPAKIGAARLAATLLYGEADDVSVVTHASHTHDESGVLRISVPESFSEASAVISALCEVDLHVPVVIVDADLYACNPFTVVAPAPKPTAGQCFIRFSCEKDMFYLTNDRKVSKGDVDNNRTCLAGIYCCRPSMFASSYLKATARNNLTGSKDGETIAEVFEFSVPKIIPVLVG
jgi:hypothetical protein